MIIWKLGGKIIRAVLFCIMNDSDTHTREQLLNLHVGLGLDFIFVCLFSFSIFCVFWC